MPELPEVETTLRGIRPYCLENTVSKVVVKRRDLRWPISDELESAITSKDCLKVLRRGKYLLLVFQNGSVIIHLGMSGSLRVVEPEQAWKKHDHVEIFFKDFGIRLHDPRRFGCVLWSADWKKHFLIQSLGVEPLSTGFNSEYLAAKLKSRHAAIKGVIMDAKVVTGVGNIYAAEALFLAKIHPRLSACTLSVSQISCLIAAIVQVLENAIAMGGTTLRDFVSQDGQPGYFKQSLNVYGREHLPCVVCKAPLVGDLIAGRHTVYCANCQKMFN